MQDTEHRTTGRPAVRTWPPRRYRDSIAARILAAAIGIGLVVVGGVALARTDLEAMRTATASVWVFDHTALMALVDLGAGALFLLAASVAGRLRGNLLGFGSLTAAFGAVLTIEPGIWDSAFGGGREVGYLYIAAGAIAIIGSILVSPPPDRAPSSG